MYFQEHEPAHFHAEYQGRTAVFDSQQHRVRLEANWGNMKAGRSLERIAPLE